MQIKITTGCNNPEQTTRFMKFHGKYDYGVIRLLGKFTVCNWRGLQNVNSMITWSNSNLLFDRLIENEAPRNDSNTRLTSGFIWSNGAFSPLFPRYGCRCCSSTFKLKEEEKEKKKTKTKEGKSNKKKESYGKSCRFPSTRNCRPAASGSWESSNVEDRLLLCRTWTTSGTDLNTECIASYVIMILCNNTIRNKNRYIFLMNQIYWLGNKIWI